MLHRVVETENAIPFRKTKRGFNIHAELVMHKPVALCQWRTAILCSAGPA